MKGNWETFLARHDFESRIPRQRIRVTPFKWTDSIVTLHVNIVDESEIGFLICSTFIRQNFNSYNRVIVKICKIATRNGNRENYFIFEIVI